MSSILRITDPILNDDSIDKYEYFEYYPITGTNLDNIGDIRINIESQDIFTHPSESILLIEGRLTKVDGTEYGNGDNISLTNNSMMYLFRDIRYELSGQEIEKVNYVGYATTMLGLLKYTEDFGRSKGLNQSWYKDSSNIANPQNLGFWNRYLHLFNNSDVNGSFSFRIPLKHIFGFCEDYDKVVYGFKHTLSLTRTHEHDAIFRAVGVDAGKIVLNKLTWFMPHVMPANKDKMELYKIIEKKEKVSVGYRMIQCTSISVPQLNSFSWRLSVKSSPEVPRFIIVGFQTERNNDQTKNNTVFDDIDISKIYVMLNSNRYPTLDYDLNFPSQKFSRAYGDVAEFRSKFFNINELISNPTISAYDYKTLYPLFLFDVSKQSERLKYSTTDIQVKIEFNEPVPLGTEGYAVIISDRLINFQSDGNKMGVVF